MEIAKEVLRVRLSQMIINEKYKKGEFKVPIHLALGHEAIAVAIDSIMEDGDFLVLTHRNIHYNLARSKKLKPEVDEFLLKPTGLNQGMSGSMNLSNRQKGIIYTSSILGNNLGVAAGLSLSKKIKQENGIIIVVTGDGAVEEGAFYEFLVFLKSNNLTAVVIIENNEWSLATKIDERRCDINIKKITDSININYENLDSNDIVEYIKKLEKFRKNALEDNIPLCVEVELTTLGGYYVKDDRSPEGRFVNYHAGPAKIIDIKNGPIIDNSDKDPVYVLKKYFADEVLDKLSKEITESLEKEIL